ncbi:MAG: AMP-binding protein, partial [Pseudomonadota bacterium]
MSIQESLGQPAAERELEFPSSRYDDLVAAYRWQIPEHFNIGVDVCDRWAEWDPNRTALIDIGTGDSEREISFGALRNYSNRIANVLVEAGIRAGDRVAILLPQRWETAAAHIALYKLGVIAVPLSALFGPDALAMRLSDAGCTAVITNIALANTVARLRNRLPGLNLCFTLDGKGAGSVDLDRACMSASVQLEPVATKADDPAMIIYTSGTTGPPKGTVHAHRVLLGHLPGMEMAFDLFPQPGDRMWSPADWSWIGGLLVVLLPALHHGIPVVARRGDPLTGAALFEILARYRIRNALLPPAALRLMRTVAAPEKRWTLSLRSVTAGGESLTPDLFHWAKRALGLTVNESYGQSECNLTIAGCDALGTAQAGWMGRQTPGHRVAILNDKGDVLAPGK